MYEREDLPELVANSKSPGNTPEKVAEVLQSLGYNVTASAEVTAQPTPDEIAEAERVEQEAATATAAAEATETAEKEEKERTTRNERRRLAKEADKKAIADATSRAEAAERRANELAESQEQLKRDMEDMRKNPPKVAPGPAAPVEPKRPQRVDFVDKEDAEAAYEDALIEYSDARREYRTQLAEHNKPKTQPAKEEPKTAPATQQQPTYSDDELKSIDVAKISQPPLKRFIESVNTVTAAHPGAYKAIVDNVPNVNDAIIQAGHTFDEPARIQLYLAKHPEDSKRIKALTDGNVQENPRLLRLAQKELEKIEQLAAEEDAAPPAGGSETEDETPPDPETDAAAARITTQPQRPAAAAPPAKPAAKQQKKHEPISPVGAHGAQTETPYDKMSEEEQKKLSIDEVRRLRGML